MKKFSLIILIPVSIITLAQVGINTSNPQSTLHVDGAKDNSATGAPTLAQSSNDFIVTSSGSTGIGTASPDASAILDLNVTNASSKKGFLPPRINLTSITDNATIATPAKGLIVYNTNANTAQMPFGEGLYYNFGTAASPNWNKLAPQKSDFVLTSVLTVVATTNVDVAAGTTNNNDLGLSTTIVVPANTTARVILDYSVPVGSVGATPNNTNIGGYFGIRFLKNGTEQEAGSRKYSVPFANSGSKMVSVAGKFSEEIVNSTAAPISLVYTLNGYVESTEIISRFNMWATTGSNFNWGRGSMTATVFTKN